jgi:uncharacterized NAD(P)/FAD-binding protein YdhS
MMNLGILDCHRQYEKERDASKAQSHHFIHQTSKVYRKTVLWAQYKEAFIKQSMSNLKEVAIIGDGFAAAVMVVHLLRKGVPISSMAVIGHGELGKGNAYNCVSPFFRLNIRDDLPIIFSEDPLDFARWAKKNIHDPEAKTEAGDFYRRQDFGRYVSDLIHNQPSSSLLEQIKARVLSLTGSENSWRLELDNQKTVHAKRVIVATGNPPPTWPCAINNQVPSSLVPRLVENPWTGSAIEDIASQEDIILLGGGLTALDAINALEGRKHRGMIYVIAPRAVFPPAQAKWQRGDLPHWPQTLSPAQMIRFMRNYLPSAPTTSLEWQSAWEELRPNLNTLWQQFSPRQRRALFKRLGWLWNLYRFRASPQTISAYERLKDKNQIQFILGRAKEVKASESKVMALLGNGIEIEGDRILNCTGAGFDPLLRKLIESKLAITDALGHSIAVDENFRVLQSINIPWNSLWMIGPATMGSLGDVIAASAIAKQAEQLAIQLSENA